MIRVLGEPPGRDRRVTRDLRARVDAAMQTAAMSTFVLGVVISAVSSMFTTALAGVLAWFAAMMATAGVQRLIARTPITDSRWFRRVVLGQLMSGAVWGALPLLIKPTSPTVHVILGAGLVSVMATTSAFASPIRATSSAFLVASATVGGLAFFLSDRAAMNNGPPW